MVLRSIDEKIDYFKEYKRRVESFRLECEANRIPLSYYQYYSTTYLNGSHPAEFISYLDNHIYRYESFRKETVRKHNNRYMSATFITAALLLMLFSLFTTTSLDTALSTGHAVMSFDPPSQIYPANRTPFTIEPIDYKKIVLGDDPELEMLINQLNKTIFELKRLDCERKNELLSATTEFIGEMNQIEENRDHIDLIYG